MFRDLHSDGTHILLQAMHGYFNISFVAIAAVVYAIILTYKLLQRQKSRSFLAANGARGKGCIAFAYIFTVVICITILSVSGISMLAKSIYNIITLPRYEATVIGNETYYAEDTDSEGRSRRTKMYTPIVVYTEESARQHEAKVDMSSSQPAQVGSTIVVGVSSDGGSVEEISGAKYLMLLGLATMMIILVYVLVLATAYAWGRSTAYLLRWGYLFVCYYIIPAGMLLLLWGCGYQGAYMYFVGRRNDMPIWALIICVVFSIVLLMAIIGWFKMLLGNLSMTRKRIS